MQQPPVFQPQQPVASGQPRPMLSMGEAIKTCLRKYATFTGRARRSEYWWFMLFVLCVSWACSLIGLFIPLISFVGMIISLLLLIPQYAALTRRLHDTGHSGWWVAVIVVLHVSVLVMMGYLLAPHMDQLASSTDSLALAQVMADAAQEHQGVATATVICAFLTLLLSLITFLFSLRDSQRTANKYGPSPKY